MSYLIGMDMGTSSVKAILMTEKRHDARTIMAGIGCGLYKNEEKAFELFNN